jgi:hypothetical protein
MRIQRLHLQLLPQQLQHHHHHHKAATTINQPTNRQSGISISNGANGSDMSENN